MKATHLIAIFIVFVLSIFLLPITAQIHEPFPIGYSMGNLGSINQSDGPGGRQGWSPAAYYRDTLRAGLSFATATYFDKATNMASTPYRTILGGFFSGNKFTCKAALSFFDASGYYQEQDIFLSTGYLQGRISGSVEFRALRYGVPSIGDFRILSSIGGTLQAMFNHVFFSLSIPPQIIYSSNRYRRNDFRIQSGLHSVPNRFGSQGIIFEVRPGYDKPLRLIIGEEYRFTPEIGISFAAAGNPTLLSIAVIYEPRPFSATAGIVNHTYLGWSKGISLEYFN
ncbi:hypothetical protein CHISP_1519 [Chitinispirillum alkaliphilum]|nr:hypothetical protein CHISP_1519 [Chitinispirillum alkaliphilum]